ncbi:intermediate conductance calcium-activated potassium channel protein 4-like [Mobula birostris]|uniref:intermediate conductance calcium-activated potassium channel protein 4-like n=1 Tax=Mobula birostris TaxID=1983395 RepID=UPI003B28342E
MGDPVICVGDPALGGRSNQALLPEVVASRLQHRRALVLRQRHLCNVCLALVVLGIGLVIASTELAWHTSHPYIVDTLTIINTVSSLLLLALTLAYHRTSLQLLMMDEGLGTWRAALTLRRRAYLALEMLVCLLQPLSQSGEGDGGLPGSETVPLAAASLLRLHWVRRALLLNSPLLQPSYRALGSLGRVRLRSPFALKLLMETCGGRLLLVFASSLWLLGSWTLSLCERTNNGSSSVGLLDSMWLIPITFLTIGYGDISPHTYFGKFICLLTGITGVCCTALLIAVVSQKLQLCSDEKHVHNFMQEMRLQRQVQRAAVDLIGSAWLVYRRVPGSHPRQARQLQRSLVTAVHRFRNAKQQERRHRDQINSMMGPSKMYHLLQDLNQSLSLSCSKLDQRLTALTNKVDGLASDMKEISALLHGTSQQLPRH